MYNLSHLIRALDNLGDSSPDLEKGVLDCLAAIDLETGQEPVCIVINTTREKLAVFPPDVWVIREFSAVEKQSIISEEKAPPFHSAWMIQCSHVGVHSRPVAELCAQMLLYGQPGGILIKDPEHENKRSKAARKAMIALSYNGYTGFYSEPVSIPDEIISEVGDFRVETKRRWIKATASRHLGSARTEAEQLRIRDGAVAALKSALVGIAHDTSSERQMLFQKIATRIQTLRNPNLMMDWISLFGSQEVFSGITEKLTGFFKGDDEPDDEEQERDEGSTDNIEQDAYGGESDEDKSEDSDETTSQNRGALAEALKTVCREGLLHFYERELKDECGFRRMTELETLNYGSAFPRPQASLSDWFTSMNLSVPPFPDESIPIPIWPITNDRIKEICNEAIELNPPPPALVKMVAALFTHGKSLILLGLPLLFRLLDDWAISVSSAIMGQIERELLPFKQSIDSWVDSFLEYNSVIEEIYSEVLERIRITDCLLREFIQMGSSYHDSRNSN